MHHRARFLIHYAIGGSTYGITLPGISAAHVRAAWDRPGAKLLSVQECDRHGQPL